MFDKTDSLIVELTTACNLRCVHCAYWRSNATFLEHDLYAYLLRDFVKSGLQTVMFSGGEPLLHPIFTKFMKTTKDYGLKIKVASNGTLLCNDVFLSNVKDIDELIVSLDADCLEVYQDIRGINYFKHIEQSLYKISTNINRPEKMSASFLIQHGNFRCLPGFISLCKDFKLNSVSILVPNRGGDFQRFYKLDEYAQRVYLNKQEQLFFLNEVFPIIEHEYIKNPSFFNFGKNHLAVICKSVCFLLFPEDQKFRKSICSLPLRTAFLYSDGTITLCPYRNGKLNCNISDLPNIIARERAKMLFLGVNDTLRCYTCLEVPLD